MLQLSPTLALGHQKSLPGRVGHRTEIKAGMRESLKLVQYLLRLLLGKMRAVWIAAPRWLLDLPGWLLGRLRPPPLLQPFERRFFRLRRWHVLLASVAALQTVHLAVGLVTGRAARRRRRLLQRTLLEAATYEDWSQVALELDALEGRRLPQWLSTRSERSMTQRAARLRRLRAADDLTALMWVLRQDSSRSVATLLGKVLEGAPVRCFVVPPPVKEYILEVQEAIRHVCASPALPIDDRLAFLREVRHAYGRTGLVLSGGGSFGHFHFGVVRSLLHAGLLPRVVSGSSAGSIGGALLCTRTDSEVGEMIDTWMAAEESVVDFFGAEKGLGGMLRHLFTQGVLHSVEEYVVRLQRLMGDLTFAEAFQRTGRILNISVTAADTNEPTRILNYLTAPNAVIYSAVACSSAFPFLFAPQELLAKNSFGRVVRYCDLGTAAAGQPGGQRRWCDGSLEEDLPMRGLSEMFNVNYFVVSQCNPYLVPILGLRRLLPHKLQLLGEWELKHRLGQLLLWWPQNRLLKLMCQPWTGDVTVVLPLAAFPLLRSAVNFTQQEIVRAMQEGQRAVWGKLEAIRASCAVEVCIDEELRGLATRARARRRREERAAAFTSRLRRTNIPSWIDLRTLGGLPNSDSADDVTSGRASLDGVAELLPTSSAEIAVGSTVAQALAEAPEQEAAAAAAAAAGGSAAEPEGGEAVEEWGGRGEVQAAAAAPLRLEGGIAAWRDLTELAMGCEGLDVIAP